MLPVLWCTTVMYWRIHSNWAVFVCSKILIPDRSMFVFLKSSSLQKQSGLSISDPGSIQKRSHDDNYHNMASTNLDLECEGCNVVFVTIGQFLRHPCMAAGIFLSDTDLNTTIVAIKWNCLAWSTCTMIIQIEFTEKCTYCIQVTVIVNIFVAYLS